MKPNWSTRGLNEEARVNVTPLIDVVMCLIVFYLMVGHLVIERRAEADLPESATGTPAESVQTSSEPLVLTLNAASDDSLTFERRTIELADLEPLLRVRLAREPALRVQLRAARDLPYALVDPVIDACRSAGLTSIDLATEQRFGPSSSTQ